MRLFNHNSGDTIVEVFIAIAVLSLVLGGAYSIAGKSLNNVRQAQEHSTALKIAEVQIEQIKSLHGTGNTDIFTQGSGFCTAIIAAALDVVANTAPECTITNGLDYRVNVTRTGAAPNFTFRADITWPSIHGDSDDNVSLVYNLNR